MIQKIISGGQTGADQAALDAAIKLGIPHGGWIPKGRPTENGKLSDKYKLKEMPTKSYTKRTEQNVIDSWNTNNYSRQTYRRIETDPEGCKKTRPPLYSYKP